MVYFDVELVSTPLAGLRVEPSHVLFRNFNAALGDGDDGTEEQVLVEASVLSFDVEESFRE